MKTETDVKQQTDAQLANCCLWVEICRALKWKEDREDTELPDGLGVLVGTDEEVVDGIHFPVVTVRCCAIPPEYRKKRLRLEDIPPGLITNKRSFQKANIDKSIPRLEIVQSKRRRRPTTEAAR